MKSLTAACMIFFLSAVNTSAQSAGSTETRVFSLNDVVRLALKSSPLYKKALSEAKAAEGSVYQSSLWENPEFFGTTEEWPVEQSIEESRYLFGISQTIPYPRKRKLSRLAASEDQVAKKEMSKSVRAEIIRQVRVAFFQTLTARKLVKESDNLLSLASSSVETAREREAAGVSTTQEVLRAEVQAERVKNNRAFFVRNLKVAKSQLMLIVGTPEISIFELNGRLHEEIPERLQEGSQSTKIAQHPATRVAEAAVRRRDALKKRAELEPYPDVTLRFAGGRREVTNETLVDFGFSVPIPLFDDSRGRIQTASAEQDKARHELERVKQSLRTRLQNEMETLYQTYEQVKNYRERLVPKSEHALEMVRTGFQEGEYGFNDLIDIQRTMAEARIDYIQKLFEFNCSIAAVKSLLEPDRLFEEEQ